MRYLIRVLGLFAVVLIVIECFNAGGAKTNLSSPPLPIHKPTVAAQLLHDMEQIDTQYAESADDDEKEDLKSTRADLLAKWQRVTGR